jgi:hypothetical protein
MACDEDDTCTESGDAATAAAAAADADAAWGAVCRQSLDKPAGDGGMGREPKPRTMGLTTDGPVADGRGADVDSGMVPECGMLRERRVYGNR